MSSARRCVVALAVVGAALTVAASAGAEPLVPLQPNETQYLDHVRQVFSVARDNTAFRGDGELLELGYYVCELKGDGLLGAPANRVSPIINQVAPIYLCPS